MTKDLILNLIQNGQTSLLNTFNAVPDDKLNWKPLDKGRSALDAFGDAAQTCGMVAKLIESQGEATFSREMFAQMAQERARWDKAAALAAMNTNAAALYSAIGTLSDEDLAQPITMSVGGGMTLPLAGWIMMVYRTCVSRFAQINYIQTLYGDTESH